MKSQHALQLMTITQQHLINVRHPTPRPCCASINRHKNHCNNTKVNIIPLKQQNKNMQTRGPQQQNAHYSQPHQPTSNKTTSSSSQHLNPQKKEKKMCNNNPQINIINNKTKKVLSTINTTHHQIFCNTRRTISNMEEEEMQERSRADIKPSLSPVNKKNKRKIMPGCQQQHKSSKKYL